MRTGRTPIFTGQKACSHPTGLILNSAFANFQKSEELWEKLGWPYELAKNRYEVLERITDQEIL